MFHKIRNLHPNVRVGAEKVLDKLQEHYMAKIIEK